ncbi:MAG: purine-binding chemotaxis protein CheW [Gammaproteobacteria bacterium]|nr:purine-binding chemotaxis protein CheW [Gammaproteobacteria bacterium]
MTMPDDGSRSEGMALLRQVARSAAAFALPLPARQAMVEPWRGLGFNVGGNRLVSELGQVLEVLAPPRLTPIPGVEDWVLGVANVRGRLLPVVDLCTYLGLENTTGRSEWRTLVVEDGDLYCGLLVEQSFGMLQFEPQEAEVGVDEKVEPGLARFIRGSYRQSARQWWVMEVRALVREPKFFEVGVSLRRSA